MECKLLKSSIESGEWISTGKSDIEKYKAFAKEHLKKDQRISLRLSDTDLKGLQRRAFEEGIPYQTLIGSILHKFLTGKLKEVK